MTFVMEWYNNTMEELRKFYEGVPAKLREFEEAEERELQNTNETDSKKLAEIRTKYQELRSEYVSNGELAIFPEGCYRRAYREVFKLLENGQKSDEQDDGKTLEYLEFLINYCNRELKSLEGSEEELIQSFAKDAIATRIKIQFILEQLNNLGLELEDNNIDISLTMCEREMNIRHLGWTYEYKKIVGFTINKNGSTQELTKEEYHDLVKTYTDEQCCNLLPNSVIDLNILKYVFAERAGRERALRVLLGLAQERKKALEKAGKEEALRSLIGLIQKRGISMDSNDER